MTAVQSSICGSFSGNNNSNNTNTIYNCGVQVPSYVPATFEELIKCTGWGVSPPEIDLDHLRDGYNLPRGDTGKWIFEEVVYRRWRESEESKLLWLCGGPGTGKTMLAKRVAAEFLKELNDLPNEVKLVFHFVSPELPTSGISTDEAELPQSRLAKVASDLLNGILQQDGSLFNGCKAELQKQGDRFFTNPCSLWKVLRKTIQECKTDPIYILIDGVDGLRESLCKELIERILELMGICTVKIFLSCRDVPHISNNLPRSCRECTKINLDTNRFVKEDVETFIRRRVNTWGWEDDLRERAMEALLAKSEGIFLWASLAIDNLTYFSSGPDFDKILKKPRSGLEDVYRKMLHTILSRGEPGEVLNMIWSVSLALRPLTFSELGHILACFEEKARAKQRSCCARGTNSEIQPRTEKEIRIYVRSSMGFLRATAETVSIVHHTAIEYLIDEYSKGGLPVLSKGEAELAVSWECFRYLHCAFGDPERFPRGDVRWDDALSRDSSFRGDRQGEEPGEASWEVARGDPQQTAAKRRFLRYASECWHIHARRSIEISKGNFCDSTHNWLQHQFFETSDIIRKPWIELCGDVRMKVLAGEQTPLHIAVCLGLMPLVEKALSEFTQGMNSYWSPLHLAARFISGAYKILIDKSEPSLLRLPDQDGNTPLHEAAISGHLSMLNALVKKFADHSVCHDEINKKNHFGNTPLHLAFQFDHAGIVELLVDKGADLTVKNNAQLTAPELGAELGRGDSLNILKRDERKLAEAKKGIAKEPPYLRENPGDLTTTLFSDNTNITNNHSVQVRSYVPVTFEELMVRMGWVAPPEIDLKHLRDEYNEPKANTRKCIFKEVRYRTWRESRQSKLLWLCGGPGTGKTMLAKRVAAEFLKGLDNSPNAVKLVFYFVPPQLPTGMNSVHEAELSQPGLSKVASDLLYSILQQDGNLFEGYKAELAKQGDRLLTNPSFLWMLLTKAIWECRADPVYILIDGVDRLKEGSCKELIRRTLELRKIRKVKIFLSSRDVPYISKNLPHSIYEFTKINLDTNSPANEDPETLTRSRVNVGDWDAELSERAAETHLAKSEGTLPPELLVIESLKHLSLGSDFDEFLRKPRLGLEDLYEKMLDTLFSRGVSLEVLSTIWCVALALRPVTFGELGYILVCIEEKTRAKLGLSHGGTRGEIQPRVEKEIRMYVQSSMGFLRATDTTLSILHHTAREYLFNESSKGNLPVLSKSGADLAISWECFRYLHHVFGDPEIFPKGEVRGHHNGSRDSSLERDRPGKELQEIPCEAARKDPQGAAAKWPYLRYAAEFWFIHACRSIEILKAYFGDNSAHNWFQYQFFGASDIIRKPWIELCGDSRMEILAGEQTPLHIAVCLGLAPLIEKALRGFTKGTIRNLSPLHLAAKFMSGAHEILIAKGGDSLLTARDRNGNTPLHAAVIFGHSSMLVGLVEKFATPDYAAYNEINKKNYSGNTPLHLAFQFDYPSMVRFLVMNGADPNIKNNAQVTASQLGENLGRGDCLDVLKQARPVERRPVEWPLERPVERRPVERRPVGQWPVEQPSVEQPPVEQWSVGQRPVEPRVGRPRSRLWKNLWKRLQTKPQTSPGGAS